MNIIRSMEVLDKQMGYLDAVNGILRTLLRLIVRVIGVFRSCMLQKNI